jgi:hypothetical protein
LGWSGLCRGVLHLAVGLHDGQQLNPMSVIPEPSGARCSEVRSPEGRGARPSDQMPRPNYAAPGGQRHTNILGQPRRLLTYREVP